MPDTNAKPNAKLIAEIKTVLSLAEAGSVTNAVIVAVGAKVYHRTFSVPLPEDMPMMIGEVSTFQTEMELLVIANRSAQQENRSRLLQPDRRLQS